MEFGGQPYHEKKMIAPRLRGSLSEIQEAQTLPISSMTLSARVSNSTYSIGSSDHLVVGATLLDGSMLENSPQILAP